MARLITKFKYLKPEDRKNVGGYAEYIATREGVEKIDESRKFAPATDKQRKLIQKILSDFPDSRSSLEYEDYLKDKTVGAASEFITRMLEENADEMMHTKTYADYIATRPRAERIGSHGLFTDDGVAVDLQKVSDELNAHTGNVWTAIVSLRREDAERLGYDNGSRWRDMLRSQTQTLSENLKIPMSNLRWFAAFHNESYHPHVHMIVYSTDPTEGYLSEKGLMALRSSFAKDIFAQDLLCEYKKQTEHRDTLKAQSREVLAELIAKINGGIYDNSQVETLLQTLAKRLAVTNGKKQYGYLRKDIKEIKRGEIYAVDFGTGFGSEQGGTRPSLILQNDIGNKHSPTTIVAAITGRKTKAALPTHVKIMAKGLKTESAVLLEQIRTIDKARLGEYIGRLDSKTLAAVDRAIVVSLGIKYLEELIHGR